MRLLTAYGWQAVPNRSSVQVGAGPALTTTYDDANRPSADSAGGTYASDADGRLTTRPGYRFEWDSLGRLTKVKPPSGNNALSTYTYDPADRLLVVDHGGSDRIRLRYVGLTTSIAGLVDDQGGSVIRHIGSAWTGEPVSDWTGSGANLRVYGSNGHHDLTWTASSSGAVSATLRYDPWGTLTASSGASLPDLRFQGQYRDPETDLVWMVSRWYAPSLGRFVSEDSLLGDPASPPSRHLYAYGEGEPVGRWDPDGRFWYKVKAGDTIWSIAVAIYGVPNTSWIRNANVGGRITPVNLTTIKAGVTAKDCIWIPWRNRPKPWDCNPYLGRTYNDYSRSLYWRYEATLEFVYQRIVENRKSGAGGVGQWSDCPMWFAWCYPSNSAVAAAWGAKNCYDCAWDYKAPLAAKYSGGSTYRTPIGGDPAPERLFYDVWTNIHYGYVGRAHGIPADILHAGAEQLGGTRTISDWVSVELGISLWSSYGLGLTKSQLAAGVLSRMKAYRNDPTDVTEVLGGLRP